MGEIIIGTEAVASGVVTRHELARWYRPMFPNVHAPRGRPQSLYDRTVGAWLWTKRGGVVAGLAASALHGAGWVDDSVPVELIWNCTRPPHGVVVRNERIDADELCWIDGLPVTSPARTALDLGRFRVRTEAVARLDAMARVCPYSAEDVLVLAKRYRGARGVANLKAVLPLVDGGAASPRETWLRLLALDSGLPQPTTQVPGLDESGRLVRVLDLCWEDFQVAAEYDGEQHQTDRRQYVKDMRVIPELGRLGWTVVQVIREQRGDQIIDRLHRAMMARGWRGPGEIAATQ